MPPPYHSSLLVAVLSASSLFLAGCASGTGSSATSTSATTTTPISLSITAVSPTNVPVGSSDLTLVVNGTGFANGAQVSVNNVMEPTTIVSSTEARAIVAAAQLKVGAVLSVAVTSGSTVVKADPNAVALSVDNPVPAVSSVSPSLVSLGTGDTMVTVTGANFVQGVVLSVNGTPRTSTFVSDTQFTAQLLASDFTSAAALPLNAINPKPGGGTSGTRAFVVNNPLPAISGLSPSSALVGSGDTTVTATGTGLLVSTVVQVNGATHTATYVNGSQMSFVLSAAELASASGLSVTLANPLPGGGTSAASNFAVRNPAPSIAAVSPMSLSAGSDATTLVITGTGFVRGSAVQINGTTHTSTYVSATEVDVPLSSSELTNSGSLSLTVTNAQPGGGTSPAAAVGVNNPVPAIASLSPANIDAGSSDTTITIAGTGFLPLTKLQINGTAHSVTYKTGKQMVVMLTATELAAAANYSLVLSNDAPGGGASSTAALTVSYPAPIIAALSPAAAPIGSAGISVTITGTGFLPTSTVQAVGLTRGGAAYVSGTQMTVPLTASDFLYSGTYSILVTNPSAYGGPSKPATFTVQAKVPVLSTVTPTSVATNSGPYTVGATGSNFTSSSKLFWNGTQLVTNYQTSYVYINGVYTVVYSLYGIVPQELLTASGSASVTVSTPTAASVSNALTISITDPPAPSITSLSPNAVPVKADATVSILGSGFAKNSVVSYNGTSLTTTFNSNTSLSATIPARMLAVPGNGPITVSTPAPGGGTSPAAPLTTYLPIISNNMVFNPVSGMAYLSIPSTGSAVTGNSIVSFDPATGALGTPIFVGSEPGVMAVSDDGKTLWVALNGTYAIRKVDLTSGVAGVQYSFGSLGYSYNASGATAMLVLPGTTDSVVVTNGYTLGIYDAGVLRGSTVNANSVYGLQADKSRSELYVGTSYNAQAYLYSSSGLTLKSSGGNNYNYYVTNSNFDEIQLGDGKIFTDFGRVFDAESGGLLGSFMSGTTNVTGPTLYDADLSQVYVLTNATASSYSSYTQINLYNPTDYSNTTKSFAWNVPYFLTDAIGGNTVYLSPHRLTRWGANGLLLHTKGAMFTAQSNTIKDQSSISADVSVSIASSGGTATGSTTIYTATVKNNGPQAATDVALAVQAPSTGIITATLSTTGSCLSLTGCNLGTLAANGSATVTVKVLQTTSGTGTLYETVVGSSTDPDGSNNTASSIVAVTGDTYNLVPALTSISPNAVKMGSADTVITLTGSNFASGSQVMLGTTALTTKFVSGTQLTATVPSANLASMGWSAVSVSTPSPGGGNSNSRPFTVINVITVGLNHIVYEPYTRKLLASASTGSSSVTGSSIVSIDPITGTFGSPIVFPTAPTTLSLSSSGKTLYTALNIPTASGATTVPFGRVDVGSGSGVSTSLPVPSGYYGAFSVVSAAVQPGTENVLAVSRVNTLPTIFDYDGTTKTLIARSGLGNYYYGTCITFLDANNLLSTYSSTIDYTVTIAGLGSYSQLTYPNECFQLSGNTAATASGKFYNVTSGASTVTGSVVLPYSYGTSLPALDTALGTAFFAASTSTASSNSTDGLISYDLKTYLRTGSIFLNIPTIEGSTYSSTISDIVRWGQDGLALVTSSGHLYLLRGPFVVPQELATNSAATLTSSSATTIASGTSNTLLTLTGTNFMPGVAVTWNESYRTTTFVDATHVTVAIPAADLATATSGKLVATNPGAPGSSALIVTVQ